MLQLRNFQIWRQKANGQMNKNKLSMIFLISLPINTNQFWMETLEDIWYDLVSYFIVCIMKERQCIVVKVRLCPGWKFIEVAAWISYRNTVAKTNYHDLSL